jgi:uncharacterized membrane protein YkvA (DUF1232 family)
LGDKTTSPVGKSSALRELAGNGRLAWHLFRDERVPMITKAVPALALLYIVSPVDFISDMAPGIGQVDDLAIVLLAVKLFISLAPQEIVAEHEGRGDTVSATYRVAEDEDDSGT